MFLVSCSAKNGSGPSSISSEQSGLEIPCDPKRVLEAVCQQCHTNPTRNSAPFPLMTYADTQAVASGEPIWHYMRIVVQSGVMPLPPVQMSATDRDTLSRWLNSGAPARIATDACGANVSDGGGEFDAGLSDSAGDEANSDSEIASGDGNAPDGFDGTDAPQADALPGIEDDALAPDASPNLSD